MVGFASAAATFLGVWIGHVSVRKLEREVERIWVPAAAAFVLGLGLELLSLWTSSRALSAFCAILGVTLLWDSLEFSRQQNRVRKGHAPANPHNPRHAHILARHPEATTIDWLDRDPRGSAITKEDYLSMRELLK